MSPVTKTKFVPYKKSMMAELMNSQLASSVYYGPAEKAKRTTRRLSPLQLT